MYFDCEVCQYYGCSGYIFQLNRSIDSNWQFFSCASIAFSERHDNVTFTFNSNKSPTWCNNFSVYYPDVCLQLNSVFPPINRSSMTAVAASGFTFVSWWQSCCVRGQAGIFALGWWFIWIVQWCTDLQTLNFTFKF